MRVALGSFLLFACATISNCKSSSSSDLSSPETALKSFFKAIDESRIPSEIDTFVLDKAGQASWRHRCKNRGCKKAKFEIVEVKERGESGATLIVDYTVFGNNNLVVMQGRRSPIRFERIGSNWGIVQQGRRIGAPQNPIPPTDIPRAISPVPANTPRAASTKPDRI